MADGVSTAEAAVTVTGVACVVAIGVMTVGSGA